MAKCKKMQAVNLACNFPLFTAYSAPMSCAHLGSVTYFSNLRAAISWLRGRLFNRPDTEAEQSLVRITITAIALLYIVTSEQASAATVQVLSFSLAGAVLILAHIAAYPRVSVARRLIALASDHGTCFILLFLNPIGFAFFLFTPLWTSSGFALRYGPMYGHIATAGAVVGMLLVGLFTEYWHNNQTQLYSWVLVFGLVPPYISFLGQRIEKASIRFRVEAERLAEAANRDPLTGLANRRAFESALDALRLMNDEPPAVGGGGSQQQRMMSALIYLDLDGFKAVNDRAGHGAGDALLCSVARTLVSNVRHGDMVARLGGDEFAALLHGFTDRSAVEAVAEKLLAALRTSSSCTANTQHVSASIGIVLLPSNAVDIPRADELLRRADEAMYRAKHRGKDNYEFASEQTRVRA